MPMTIQATGKDNKALLAVSAVIGTLGGIIYFVGAASRDGGTMTTGIVFFVIGLVVGIVGRIGAWWDNG